MSNVLACVCQSHNSTDNDWTNGFLEKILTCIESRFLERTVMEVHVSHLGRCEWASHGGLFQASNYKKSMKFFPESFPLGR